MNVPDANVLLYAVNEADPKHNAARSWLRDALNGTEPVGFAWTVVLAFIRLSTKVGVFPRPLTVQDACQHVREWLSQPPSVVIEPGNRHVSTLSDLLAETGSGGNLVVDAHLAAIALAQGATVITYDRDFDRFEGVRSHRP